jgi:hypothetical protein
MSSAGASELEDETESGSINILLPEDALAPVLFISTPMPTEEESGVKSFPAVDHGSSSGLDTRTISSSDPSADFVMKSFIAELLLLFLLLSTSLLCGLESDEEEDGVLLCSAAEADA